MNKNEVIKFDWDIDGEQKRNNNFFISELQKKIKSKISNEVLEKNIKDMFDNISRVRDFCGIEKIEGKEKNYTQRLLDEYLDRAIKCANAAFIHFESNGLAIEINGMALFRYRNKKNTSSDNNEQIMNSYDNLIKDKDKILQKEYNDFRKRALLAYSELYKKNDLEEYCELEYLSSTCQGCNIGETLLESIEKYIIDKDKNKSQKNEKYILVTNELCNYGWFDSHGFKRVDENTINVKDLKIFNKLANEIIKNRSKDGYIKCLIYEKEIKSNNKGDC